ncbi:MAG: LL-diaminopimelate aminotransferase [Victivallaceae bacterium]|nr:LL-diaminopimelate aminotransferase [Victivallaceae bacterium]
MAQINFNYDALSGNYLFAEIARKISAYRAAHPDAKIIRLGIGDVTLPLAPAVVAAMHEAVDELSRAASFHGYGPERGYDFLAEAILQGEYRSRGVDLDLDEIFISDGSKCDVGNIQEIFAPESVVAVADPVYPVYLDSNVMAGRAGTKQSDGHYSSIVYLPCTAENNFAPSLPSRKADLIYLCSPNNPTGEVLSVEELTKWVAYARENDAVILYDSAYSSYIQDEKVPHSIYEIPGAKEVAVEFKSFSKTAGFTGVRCAFTVVPKALERSGRKLNDLWNRRQCTKFNGASYIVQRGAAAVYSPAGREETQGQIAYYMENARIIRTGLEEAGFTCYGGRNAPYIWWRLPGKIPSRVFFEKLLEECQVVGTPGVGFGPCGEGYLRLTAFGEREQTREAIGRIQKKFA